METKRNNSELENLIKVSEKLPLKISNRIKEREMSAEEWIELHGSGTLRKNKRIGFAWQKHYWHERICYEFGYGFEMLPKTRITYNDPITEGDCSAITEAGWFIERYMSLSIFDDDLFEAKYIIAEYPDLDESLQYKRKEGIGIIVKQTSFNIPAGNIIFSIVAEFNRTNNSFNNAINPF